MSKIKRITAKEAHRMNLQASLACAEKRLGLHNVQLAKYYTSGDQDIAYNLKWHVKNLKLRISGLKFALRISAGRKNG